MPMKNGTDIIALRQPESVDDPLTEIAWDVTRRMLVAVLRAEADAFVEQHVEEILPDGCQRSSVMGNRVYPTHSRSHARKKKEIVGFQVGARESAQSWRELLVDVKAQNTAARHSVSFLAPQAEFC